MDSHKTLSFSVDASTMHDQSVMIGPIATPAGVSVWMPPQVHGNILGVAFACAMVMSQVVVLHAPHRIVLRVA